MIPGTPAAFQLLTTLLDVGPEGATREYLVHKADVGTTTFYRLIKPLLKRGIVMEEGNRYVLPLTNPYNFRLKCWYDMDRLYQIGDMDRSEVLDVCDQARRSLRKDLLCLWLVGSAAHGTLGPESDLDFLAVVRKDALYHPESRRSVNFVVLTESAFREKYRKKDDFVVSALRFGVLLYDADFAQEFYEMPVSLGLSASLAHEKEQTIEDQRQRLLFYLEQGELKEARGALEALSMNVARLLLRAFGELPGGKEDLHKACRVFLGEELSRCVYEAAGRSDLTREEIVNYSRELAGYHRRFRQHFSHLREFASMPYAGHLELEKYCAQIFQELLPQWHVTHDDRVDLIVQDDKGVKYAIEIKSYARALHPAQVQQFAASSGEWGQANLVLIANMYRGVPVMERPQDWLPSLQVHARSNGVSLITAIELLRVHNMLHLEEDSHPRQLVSELLKLYVGSGRKMQRKNVV